MDLLFSAVEQAFDAVRQRIPRTALLVSALLWLAAFAAYGWFTTFDSFGVASQPVQWLDLTRMMGPSLLLLLIVGIRGIAQVPVVAWPLGFTYVFLINIMIGPVGTRAEPYFWVFSVWCFLFSQLFVAVVANLDELVRQRRYGPSGYGDTEKERQTRRRLLQIRATIALSGIAVVLLSLNPDGTLNMLGKSGDHVRLGVLAGEALLPLILIAMFIRRRGTAWAAACGLAVATVVVLFALSPERRAAAVLQYGWLFFTACYLLLKAGNRWYWPVTRPAVRVVSTPPLPPIPAYASADPARAFPAAPGFQHAPGSTQNATDGVWIALSLLVFFFSCCTGVSDLPPPAASAPPLPSPPQRVIDRP